MCNSNKKKKIFIAMHPCLARCIIITVLLLGKNRIATGKGALVEKKPSCIHLLPVLSALKKKTKKEKKKETKCRVGVGTLTLA